MGAVYDQDECYDEFCGCAGGSAGTFAADLEFRRALSHNAIFTASCSGTALTVTAMSNGTISVGDLLFGNNALIPSNVFVVAQVSGTTGQDGVYTISQPVDFSLTNTIVSGSPTDNRIRFTSTDGFVHQLIPLMQAQSLIRRQTGGEIMWKKIAKKRSFDTGSTTCWEMVDIDDVEHIYSFLLGLRGDLTALFPVTLDKKLANYRDALQDNIKRDLEAKKRKADSKRIADRAAAANSRLWKVVARTTSLRHFLL